MRPYRQAETELRRLKRGFSRISRRLDRGKRAGRGSWLAWLPAAVALGAFGGYALAQPGQQAGSFYATAGAFAGAATACAGLRSTTLASAASASRRSRSRISTERSLRTIPSIAR